MCEVARDDCWTKCNDGVHGRAGVRHLKVRPTVASCTRGEISNLKWLDNNLADWVVS